nr:FMN-dependent NADH-azoreductase [Paraburkholderia busanensis]
MRTLLHIDSSPMNDASISRRLTWEFAQHWLRAQADGEVRYRDLARADIPPTNGAWHAANFTPKQHRTPQQHDLLALSSVFTSELRDADEYVIGVPMHNWGPSASFKLWVDQIVRQGETLTMTDRGPRGTLTGKRATFVIAAGANYGPDAASAALNFVEPWLRRLFTYLGVEDLRFVMADGVVNVLNGTVDRAHFLAPHLAAVQALFAPESCV